MVYSEQNARAHGLPMIDDSTEYTEIIHITRTSLLGGHGLGKVPRHVNVASTHNCNMVRQKLRGIDGESPGMKMERQIEIRIQEAEGGGSNRINTLHSETTGWCGPCLCIMWGYEPIMSP